jgi:hypothetical protein
LVDIGIHHVASLRMPTEVAGWGSPVHACAVSSYESAAIKRSAPDTLAGCSKWESGLANMYVLTWSARRCAVRTWIWQRIAKHWYTWLSAEALSDMAMISAIVAPAKLR